MQNREVVLLISLTLALVAFVVSYALVWAYGLVGKRRYQQNPADYKDEAQEGECDSVRAMAAYRERKTGSCGQKLQKLYCGRRTALMAVAGQEERRE